MAMAEMAMAESKTTPSPKQKPKEYIPPKVAEAFIKGVEKKNLYKDSKPLHGPKKPS